MEKRRHRAPVAVDVTAIGGPTGHIQDFDDGEGGYGDTY
jgi:hypothetical protein